MPRYQYECSTCKFRKTYFHSMTETIEICEECGANTMQKIFTNKFFTFNKTKKGNQKVGEITKKHIEDNREILETQKREAKEDTYEPS
jgi:putative FmdB family regulatory protein